MTRHYPNLGLKIHFDRVVMLGFILLNSVLMTADPGPAADLPNIIVIIADDVSWNDLGAYGNPSVQSPVIDRMAKEGLRFDNFYLTASSCSPSRNSIMTGRYPHNTGAAELHTEPPLHLVSFPELLRNNGYYTVSAGKFHMGEYARRGFDLIYEKLEDVGDGGEANWVESIRERPREKPFFMWFAAYDAHRDWGPNPFSGTHDPNSIKPPSYLADGPQTRKDLASYFDEIKRFDSYVGEVLEEVKRQGVLENTLIILMSDNGRPFPHSKTRVYDRGMKSPFIAYWPKGISNPGSNCAALISAIDLAPTILSLAGVSVPDQIQGLPFDPLFRQPGNSFRNYVFAEHNWHDYEAHERMVRNKEFLYILNSRPTLQQSGPADAVGSPSFQELQELRQEEKLTAQQADIFTVPRPTEELYDLAKDPMQMENISPYSGYEDQLVSLRDVLKTWMEDTGDNVPENLTKDWYLKKGSMVRTEHHGIRGEMPGSSNNATRINAKGPF